MRLVVLLLALFFSSVSLADLIDNVEGLKKQEPEKKPEEPAQLPQEEKKEEMEVSPPAESTTEKPKKAEPSHKAKTGVPVNESSEPVHFSSDDKAIYSRGGGTINLVKNVIISQGAVTFRSDAAEVFLNQSNANGQEDEVTKVIVNGNVRMNKKSTDPNENISARGNKAFFDNGKQTVTIIGDARIIKGGNVVKGKQITYHLKDGKIVVDRAEGVVQPDEMKETK
ncbi:MAG: LptA/OstA family protein [Oligoflexales bacterium]